MNRILASTKNLSLIDLTRQHVLNLYNEQKSAKFVYHTYQLTNAIIKQVTILANEEEVEAHDREVALLAGWFCSVGYLMDYQDPLHYSRLEAEKFLLAQEYPEKGISKVIKTIDTFKRDTPPTTVAEKLLFDAVNIVEIFQNFEEKAAFQKLEFELVTQEKINKKSWNAVMWQRLLKTKLYTHSARQTYDNKLSMLIQDYQDQMNKNNSWEKIPLELSSKTFADIEKKAPNRGVQTFFKSNYRNHINLSAIADNKANIMISVNSILISVLITALSYRNIAETNPSVILPVVIFLITGMASLIFAVLSARPKVTSIISRHKPVEEIKKNIAFFGNFSSLDLDQYEDAMEEVLNDGNLLYGNMTRDLYYLGKVLDKKYRYLTVSYNTFMVGIVSTVITFLIIMFL